MTIQNPYLLPKVRSPRLMDLMGTFPCCLRIASFIPGRRCSHQSTVVGCHLPTIGKGTATKVTDLAVVAGCMACHDLLDGRDKAGWAYLIENYPAAVQARITDALVETHARLIAAGYEWGADWEVIW
jgi:hypothetical protein